MMVKNFFNIFIPTIFSIQIIKLDILLALLNYCLLLGQIETFDEFRHSEQSIGINHSFRTGNKYDISYNVDPVEIAIQLRKYFVVSKNLLLCSGLSGNGFINYV